MSNSMTTNFSLPSPLPSKWSEFPATYRRAQVAEILGWVALGESGVVVGASGSGKSNIAGYIAQRSDVTSPLLPSAAENYCFLHFDINSLPVVTTTNFYRGLLYTLQDAVEEMPALRDALAQLMTRLTNYEDHLALQMTLHKAHELVIRRAGKQVIWLIDRFDEACRRLDVGVLNSLRSLRDQFKDYVSYIVFTRFPLTRLRNPSEFDELHEIMASHTCWVGAMSEADAGWIIQQVMKRYRTPLAENDIQQLLAITGRWPALLKVAASALASGELTPGATSAAWQERLWSLTNFQQSCHELWNDCVAGEQAALAAIGRGFDTANLDPAALVHLQQCGLLQVDGVTGALVIFSPLFAAYVKAQRRFTGAIAIRSGIVTIGADPLPIDLTRLEARLLEYLVQHAGQVCKKDDLMTYIWPDEQHVQGLSDERLTSLVRRLRKQIEPADDVWTYIEAKHGRGYQLNQPPV